MARRSVSPVVTGCWRGINISNIEYNATPSAPYDNSNADYAYIARKGFNVVRLPFNWNYLQPTENGSLDTAYRTKIDDNIGWAAANGLKIILDLHNYGRKSFSGVTHVLGDGTLTDAHVADVWTKLSTLYKDNQTVLAYSLMNEPHDLTIQSDSSNYKTTATITTMTQACINAIRANNDSKTIIIQRDWWDSQENFLQEWNIGTNPDVWWTDPLDNIWLELHTYFETGITTTEQASEKLEEICQWATAHSVQLIIGEYGVPKSKEYMLNRLEAYLRVMDTNNVHGCYWAMGGSQSNVDIGIHPGSNYDEDTVQMDILVKHI